MGALLAARGEGQGGAEQSGRRREAWELAMQKVRWGAQAVLPGRVQLGSGLQACRGAPRCSKGQNWGTKHRGRSMGDCSAELGTSAQGSKEATRCWE